MSDVVVTNASDAHRYEARVDGELAGFAEYRLTEDAIVFTHTEVESAFNGQGVGSSLARFALDDVRAGGQLKVMPLCPFIKGYIERHPEYADLL